MENCCSGFKGFALAVADNITGGNLAQRYNDGSASYNSGVSNGNIASAITGALLVADGSGNIGGGTATLAASEVATASIAGAEVGVPGMIIGGGMILKGTIETAVGGVMMHNSSKNVQKEARISSSSESNGGRTGKQARLRELSTDPKLGKADKGWLKSDINKIDKGKRKTIRNPPGKDLAHERGREAAKGYSYKYSHLQNRKDHRNQHKYDNGGRRNKERPID